MDRPIFLVGCQRSGTTMLRLVLDSHTAISCGPETRFLPDLRRLVDPARDWPRLQRFGFDRADWLRRIREFFGGVHDDYAAGRGKTRWADKTPLYALSLDFVTEVFPDAQIVHVIRDGRDVVVSHRKRFGYWSAVKCVVKWPRYIRVARAAGRALPGGRYFELRYEDAVRSPEPTLRALFAFLGETWEEDVLRYADRPHDVAAKYTVEADRRRAAAGTDAAIYDSRVGTYRRELDPFLRLLVRLFSGRTLKELGYR
ncbi:sulfotransferase family protein [Mangrovihabitans endophyticus]|uniref:Sulfotransferase n=1 Tax=Mangrovihabitans endophyticus TaxID=1751298 RepID=A0A8J3C4W9_9ACTN|nr:sulfotransferase [Mangrovihabitans endophyticus]GGL07874.1 sulfotransferase [Mangrovihabitans endophyticus]